MSDGIDEHPPLVRIRLDVRFARPDREHRRFACVEVAEVEVEMRLLWLAVGPVRWRVVRILLKADVARVGKLETHPLVRIGIGLDLATNDLLIEASQRQGIRAIEGNEVEYRNGHVELYRSTNVGPAPRHRRPLGHSARSERSDDGVIGTTGKLAVPPFGGLPSVTSHDSRTRGWRHTTEENRIDEDHCNEDAAMKPAPDRIGQVMKRTAAPLLIALAIVSAACSGTTVSTVVDTSSTTTTTSDPSVPVVFGSGSIPDTMPVEFPFPDEAVIGSTLIDRNRNLTEVIFRVPAAVTALAAFYEANLPNRDYTVDFSSGTETMWEIEFSGNASTGTIAITFGAQDVAEAVVRVTTDG